MRITIHCVFQTLCRFSRIRLPFFHLNKMLKMLVLLTLTGLFSSAWASLNLHGAPLLSGETSFTFMVETSTVVKKTPCYITSGEVSRCRRKRGMEEKPHLVHGDLEIAPSAVIRIQPTAVHRAINRVYPDRIMSSFDDTYFNSQNIFRQLAAKGRSNVITVGDCGLSTVNLSQFLSCLGMTIQETTTLTATFTETETLSSGYAIMTVMGCTPAGFPYMTCPMNTADSSTASSISIDNSTTGATTTTIEPTSTTSVEPSSTTSAEPSSTTSDGPSSIISVTPSTTTPAEPTSIVTPP